jgi:hypothetical protein
MTKSSSGENFITISEVVMFYNEIFDYLDGVEKHFQDLCENPSQDDEYDSEHDDFI